MSNEVTFPYIYVPDPTKGRPIFNGSIFIGQEDLDPEIPGNQVQLSVRQEDGTEVQVAQPILTSAGGVPQYQGSSVTLLIDESIFSIKILNSSGSQVYYQASAVAGDSTSLPFPVQNYYTDSGAVNAYVLTNSTETPTATAYFDGMEVIFDPDNDNTGASTVNINSIGIKNIKVLGGDDVIAGQISWGSNLRFDSGNDWFEFVRAGALTVGTSALDDAAVTIPKLDATVVSQLCPPGAVVGFAMATAPTTWFECDGAAVSRTTYAALFSAISTDYGVGNGSTTFNLPDLRGEFIRGWDHGAGVDPDAAGRTDRGDGTTGDNVGTKQLDEFKDHSHLALQQTGGSTFGQPAGGVDTGSAQTGSTGGNETRSRNVYMMYCIKT